MDAVDATGDHNDIRRMIENHYIKIRTNKVYERCYIRIYFENNMDGYDPGYWAEHLYNIPCLRSRMSVARHDSKGRMGMTTTHAKKLAYAHELKKSVPGMQVSEDFISTNHDPRALMKQLIEQLRAFRRDILQPKGDIMTNTVLFNKVIISGKSAGKKDDLVMALCIAIYSAFVDMTDYRFAQEIKNCDLSL